MPRAYMIVHDGIGPTLSWIVGTLVTRVTFVMESGKERIEDYAKQNAPWADRTGAARDGLTASVEEDGGEVVLELAHTVEYGIWLETIQDGAYAIIMPTLEALGPEILAEAGAQVVYTGKSF
jgi:Bacteriophage HK97-gp10, putative tail-component